MGQGGGGAIRWDPNSRDSMLQAHTELREQLIWITKHKDEVDRQVKELQEQQKIRRTLANSAHDSSDNSNSHTNSACPPYPAVPRSHATHDVGACMICMERLPSDPCLVVNLCSAEPRCQCLLHRSCYVDPQQQMNDHLRRCMICK